MPLNIEGQKRVEGYGYYYSYSDAPSVLDWISGSLDGVQLDEDRYGGPCYKVTVIVEEM